MPKPQYSPVTTNVSSRSQGVHGAGARTFKPEMANRILMVLRNECVGELNRMTVEQLATRVGLNGRAVRDVIRELEGTGQVLTEFSEGYYVCTTAVEAERGTRRLESQVQQMQQRIAARRKMAARLRKHQPALL